VHTGEIARHGDKSGYRGRNEGEADLTREALHDDEGEGENETGEGQPWPKSGQRCRTGLPGQSGERGRVSPNSEKKGDNDATDGRLDATRERKRSDSGGREVKRDGKELGDRNHLIA
jgi:hypothetical protein